ncbi:MAG TPA: hypothetical protein PKD61_37870 [Polyangiaceae bacterium]|nr:hypothetical protein [Polyangiaceae bacterium]
MQRRECLLRSLIGYIFFFSVGLVAAAAYFYQLHPEHSVEGDLPRLRKDVDDALDRGKRLREAWDRRGAQPEEPAPPPAPEQVTTHKGARTQR